MKVVDIMRTFLAKGLSQEEAYKAAERADSPEAKCAILLRAFNIPSNLIEETLGFSHEDTSNLLMLEDYNKIYNKILHKLTLVQDDRYFDTLVPRALQVKIELLENPNASPMLRDKVATDIIDRAKGKPRQSLEVKSLNYNIEGTEEELNSRIKAVSERIKEIEAMKLTQKEHSDYLALED